MEIDFSKLLNADNFTLIAEAMKIYQEIKPIVTKRLVGWINNSPTSLDVICSSLSDERAKELLVKLKARMAKSGD